MNTYKIHLKLNITENLEKSVTNFLELKKKHFEVENQIIEKKIVRKDPKMKKVQAKI